MPSYPHTSPLSPDRRAFESLVVLSHLLEATLDRRTQADAGMAHAHYAVLALVYDAPGHRMRLKTLSEELRFSPSRLSHAMTRLERLGLIERVNSEARGKSWDAVLTPAGIATVRRVAPLQMRAVRQPLLAVLDDDEVAQLGTIASKLIARLESVDDPIG